MDNYCLIIHSSYENTYKIAARNEYILSTREDIEGRTLT